MRRKVTPGYWEAAFQRKADQKSEGWDLPAVPFLPVWPWPVIQSFWVWSLISQGRHSQQLLDFSQLRINRHISKWATREKDPDKQTQKTDLRGERNNSQIKANKQTKSSNDYPAAHYINGYKTKTDFLLGKGAENKEKLWRIKNIRAKMFFRNNFWKRWTEKWSQQNLEYISKRKAKK